MKLKEIIAESSNFNHLTSKRLKSILLSSHADAKTLEWAMDYTQDALHDDYNNEMIDSRVFDARARAYRQAEVAFYDEDGEVRDDADLAKTLEHLRQFWMV